MWFWNQDSKKDGLVFINMSLLFHVKFVVNKQTVTLMTLCSVSQSESQDSQLSVSVQVLESQLLFIRDSLKLISDLYHHGNRSSAAWNTNEETNFLITIDRQNEELNKCVSTQILTKIL